jgi:hypothetical protein
MNSVGASCGWCGTELTVVSMDGRGSKFMSRAALSRLPMGCLTLG